MIEEIFIKIQWYSLSLALAVISNAAMVETYQGKGEGLYNDWSDDKAYELTATAYFEPVSTDGHPLRAAAFVERASGANLNFTRLGGLTLDIAPADGLLLSTSYRAAPVLAGSLLGRLSGSNSYSRRDSYETNVSAKYVC